MGIIFTTPKRIYVYLDIVERYQIYNKSEKGVQINYKSTITKNKIFDMIDGTVSTISFRYRNAFSVP